MAGKEHSLFLLAGFPAGEDEFRKKADWRSEDEAADSSGKCGEFSVWSDDQLDAGVKECVYLFSLKRRYVKIKIRVKMLKYERMDESDEKVYL